MTDPAHDPTGRPSHSQAVAFPPLDQDQFIAVLAHELRNPLAPIRSGLELLASGRTDPGEQRATITMMQRQLNHLVRLMDDLLDAARLSRGLLPVLREPVRLRQVLHAAFESVEPALQSKRQRLQMPTVADDVQVCADPVRLAQAFVNILSRSIRKSSPDSVIEIAIALTDEQLVLTFKDDGPGMDAEEAAEVFILFPGGRSKDRDDGLSVGLALVKGLIEANDGTVEVAPRADGFGTQFIVTLPRMVPEAGDSVPEHEPSAVVPQWRSHRLLIVDDNREAAEALGLLFELDGMTVRLALDGPSAVDEARDFEPEVILMDLGLPGFDGMEAVKRIRTLRSQVRPYVVALTGWGAAPDRDAARDAGVDLHLVKPVAYPALTAALAHRPDAPLRQDHELRS